MQNTIFVIMAIIKVTSNALDMMMSLRKVMYLYMICGNIKIEIRAILYIRKMGVVTKISIRCKTLDASPMAHVFSLI